MVNLILYSIIITILIYMVYNRLHSIFPPIIDLIPSLPQSTLSDSHKNILKFIFLNLHQLMLINSAMPSLPNLL